MAPGLKLQEKQDHVPLAEAPEPRRPERDVRRKRPAALAFLLRLETLRRLGRIVSLLGLDFTGLFLAILTALSLKTVLQGHGLELGMAYHGTKETVSFAYLVMALLFARSALYADRPVRPGFPRVVAALFQTMLVTLLFAAVNGDRFSSYYIFYGSLFFASVYIGSLRFGYQKLTGTLLRAAGYSRRALLVGSGEQIEAVAHAFINAGRQMEVVGYISLTPRPDNGLKSLGTFSDLPDVLDSDRVDEVIIADPAFPQERALDLVDQCHRRGITVRVAPSTMEILVHRAEFVPGQSVPLFELKPPVFDGLDFAIKRVFDLVGATVLLIVSAPVMLAIALAVRATSHGPILYRSIRPGIGGKTFACLKFRTMHSDAEESQAELEAFNEASGPLFKIRSDPRRTGVGRLLRRFSLDELPQLWNVLRGEMSLVGPRPLPERDFARLEEWHKKRYLVLPGVTGLWQVSGRSELDFDDLVRLDFFYLERWSIFLDLTIMLKTVPAVFKRRGAY